VVLVACARRPRRARHRGGRRSAPASAGLVLLVLAGACGGGDGDAAPTCAAAVTELGSLDGEGPSEASGLVRSRITEGVLWTHNDRGRPAELIAIDPAGRALGTWPVQDAPNIDWEDLSILGGPGQAELVVGDIGDNDAERASVTIHYLTEPDPGEDPIVLRPVDTVELRYPDGPHDAEALLVDGRSGEVGLVTKGDDAVLYVTDADPRASVDQPIVLRKVGTVWSDAEVRAGAVSPDGGLVALRTVDGLRVWRDDGPALARLVDRPSCTVVLEQKRAEGLAAPDAHTLIAVGEGKQASLFEVRLAED